MAITAVSDGATALDTDLNQYNNHLTGVAGNTLAWFLRSTAASDFKILLGDAAGARSFVIQDSVAAEVFAVDSNGVVSIGGTDITTAAGLLKHESGGLETDVSTVAIGDLLAGDGAGSIGLVTASGKSDGDVVTLQADGTVDYETPAAGVTDHGALTGLSDDDHSQYHNDARAVTWHDADNHSSLAASELPTHGSRHERAGADEVNGDHLDIDFTPANYTPSTTPAEAANVNDLAAHLAGIDEALATMGLISITDLRHWGAPAEVYSGSIATGFNTTLTTTNSDGQYIRAQWEWNIPSGVSRSALLTGDIDSLTDPGFSSYFRFVSLSYYVHAPANVGGTNLLQLQHMTGKTYATIEVTWWMNFASTVSDANGWGGLTTQNQHGNSSYGTSDIALYRGATNFMLYANGTSSDTGVAKDTSWHEYKLTINIAAMTADLAIGGSEVVTAHALATDKWPMRWTAGHGTGTMQGVMESTLPVIRYKV